MTTIRDYINLIESQLSESVSTFSLWNMIVEAAMTFHICETYKNITGAEHRFVDHSIVVQFGTYQVILRHSADIETEIFAVDEESFRSVFQPVVDEHLSALGLTLDGDLSWQPTNEWWGQSQTNGAGHMTAFLGFTYSGMPNTSAFERYQKEVEWFLNEWPVDNADVQEGVRKLVGLS